MSQILKQIFLLPVKVYRLFISPLLGPSKCRYSPTCSQYMIDAVMEWGILRGGWMGLKRIFRCHPWSTHDHFDPVPKKN
ncbi:MAG: membrane protein insertion efficiency factor YidD [Saprospiraceae bacterium]|nr:membrane protein insertion efficiency factor YidD [Saprospiraceae bacterium]